MKIKNIRLNGNTYALDDQDALQLPEGVELQDGDVLVYNEVENAFECVNRNQLVDVEKGVVENSSKLVKSGDVYTAINAAVNPNPCDLEVNYDSINNKIVFNIKASSRADLNINVGLLVLSINTHYDPQQSELNVSNVIAILYLDKSTSSTEYILDQFIDDRQFYFILINNNQNIQTCTLDKNTVLVPGINSKTNVVIVPSAIFPDDVPMLAIVSSVAVDRNITIYVSITENDETRIITDVLLAGTSQCYINIGSSGYIRKCVISIVPASVSYTQNYILQGNSVSFPANMPKKELVAIPSDQNASVQFKTIDDSTVGSDIDVQLILNRNGTSPIILTDTIPANSSQVTINYLNKGFSGPVVGIGVVANKSQDSQYQYYFEYPNITLILDGNGNPY